jgi:hypothetical protein
MKKILWKDDRAFNRRRLYRLSPGTLFSFAVIVFRVRNHDDIGTWQTLSVIHEMIHASLDGTLHQESFWLRSHSHIGAVDRSFTKL